VSRTVFVRLTAPLAAMFARLAAVFRPAGRCVALGRAGVEAPAGLVASAAVPPALTVPAAPGNAVSVPAPSFGFGCNAGSGHDDDIYDIIIVETAAAKFPASLPYTLGKYKKVSTPA
jgi:hypothetical protein